MATRSASWSRPVDTRAWATATLLGGILFAASWGLLHVGFWTHDQIVDTPVYQTYGDQIVAGRVPYRDFRPEYPPAALAVFALPSLAGESDYRTVFEWLMLACGLAIVAGLVYALAAAGAAPRRLYGAAILAGITPLALGSVVLTRYDLWPAALVAGALAALVADRSRLGLALLAVGTAAKLFPLALVPIALVWVGRRRGGREAAVALAVFAIVLATIVVPFAVVAPDGLWESFERQASRPLQIESLGASFLLAADRVGIYGADVVSTYGSQNLAGNVADLVAAVSTGFLAVAIAGVWVLFARGRDSAGRLFVACAAAIAAFVVLGKVLSPQFLIWLVPLVPLAAGTAGLLAAGLFLAALVLTQTWFPYRYWDLVALGPEVWLVVARNLVLLGLLAVLLRALTRRAGAPRTP